MAKPKKNSAALTNDQLLSICQAEIESASGYAGGELSDQRANALDRYMGELYGDEIEGRSQVVTREVMETVEWILPSLARIFMDAENCLVFDPVGPEDVEQARAETDAVNHIFFKQNRGFYNLYSLCKDALLSKTGILKIYWDDAADVEREEYSGLDDMQLGELISDATLEREIEEYEEREDGHHVVFMTTRSKGRVQIEPVPPEEFGIARNARSPYVEDADFAYHRTRKTRSELIAMGFDKKIIDSLPSNDEVDTEERLSRRHLSDEEEGLDWSNDPSMRTYWITECYVRADRNGNGVAQLCRVTMAAGSYMASGARLLDVEEVDRMPFAAAAPILLTHKFYGLSLADLTEDLQRIKSAMLRSMLDNTYLSNNGRVAVNDRQVNLEDLLTSRPGGIVRYKGDQPAGSYIMPIPHTPLPAESFGLMEYLDEVRKQRTGVGDEVAGLDKSALASVSPSVAALAFDSARMKIELVARTIAEVALVPAFRLIDELLMKHQDSALTMQLGSQWVTVNPGEWRTRHNSTVMVGTGTASRERKLMSLEAIIGRQMEQAQMGGMGQLIMPHQLYQSLADWTAASGLKPELYFTDPRTVPPPEPQPDTQQDALMMQAQALMIEAETKKERNQLDAMKMQAEMQLKLREQDLKQQEQELRAEMEQMKAHMAHLKNEGDTDTKVASLELQMSKQDTADEIKRLEIELKHLANERDREVELYKVQLDGLSKLMTQHGIQADPEVEEIKQLEQQVRDTEQANIAQLMAQLVAQNQALSEQVNEMAMKSRQPKKIIRDAKGLVVQIGDQKVERDASGQVKQIG